MTPAEANSLTLADRLQLSAVSQSQETGARTQGRNGSKKKKKSKASANANKSFDNFTKVSHKVTVESSHYDESTLREKSTRRYN